MKSSSNPNTSVQQVSQPPNSKQLAYSSVVPSFLTPSAGSAIWQKS